jgi:hypothetical protein
MTETELVKLILDGTQYSEKLRLYRRNVGAFTSTDIHGKKRFHRFGIAGQSDLYGMINIKCPSCGQIQLGRHIEIECKVGKNKLTEHQYSWIKYVRSFGGIAILATDKDFENTIGNLIENQIEKIIQEQSPAFCNTCMCAPNQHTKK